MYVCAYYLAEYEHLYILGENLPLVTDYKLLIMMCSVL